MTHQVIYDQEALTTAKAMIDVKTVLCKQLNNDIVDNITSLAYTVESQCKLDSLNSLDLKKHRLILSKFVMIGFNGVLINYYFKDNVIEVVYYFSINNQIIRTRLNVI